MKKSCVKCLRIEKKAVHLHPQTEMVPWMSGLVNGLQNRLQQFESARHLPISLLVTTPCDEDFSSVRQYAPVLLFPM